MNIAQRHRTGATRLLAVLALTATLLGPAALSTSTPVAAAETDPTQQGTTQPGYLVLTATGEVLGVSGGVARGGIEANPGADPVTLVTVDDGDGYYVVESNGRVTGFGTRAARTFGDLSALTLAQPIVDMVMTPTGEGYYLLGKDGGIFAFGDAVFRGSIPQYVAYEDLVAPAVAMVVDGPGTGYWIFAADGGVFAFGTAGFHGALPAIVSFDDLVAPIVGATPSPDGRGYGLVGGDGGVFAFGDFEFRGSLSASPPGDFVDLEIEADDYVLLERSGEIKGVGRTTVDTGAGDVVALAVVPDKGATPQPRPLNQVSIGLRTVATVTQPLALVSGPDRALYVASKTGVVYRLGPTGAPEQWLNLTGRVSTSGERGLLGIAFGPDGRFYASYTDTGGTSRVVAWKLTDGHPDPNTEASIISVAQPFSNHNGGDLQFGPDGYLYFGLGDGGSGNDPQGNGQNTDTLLGSILRLDVTSTGTGYRSPTDNPYSDHPEIRRPEIWLFGVRNPWRFSFDPGTGDLWIGDVGQSSREEIDFLPADGAGRNAGRGANLGWGVMEGELTQGDPADLVSTPTPPEYTYGRGEGVSVTGGRVYRGRDIDGLQGAYLFSDYGSGEIWALRPAQGATPQERATLATDQGPVVAFGEDARGELYVVSLDGTISRITAKR